MLNSPFMDMQAKHFVQRLESEVGQDQRMRVDHAYMILFGRSPSTEEIELAKRFLTASDNSTEIWHQYAQVLLASNELLIVD